MTLLDIALSFVISYVAGIIPTDGFNNRNSLKEKLESCFKRAVKKWTNSPEIQNAVGEQMEKYWRSGRYPWQAKQRYDSHETRRTYNHTHHVAVP